MIVNIAYPRNATQKIWKLDDEKIFSKFYDKKIGQEVDADFIAPEFKGYKVQITGGSDKNGFCMKQGVNTKNLVKLLLAKGSVGYFCKREGVRKRRTVRGCIVGPGIAAVNCIITKKGEGEIAGLTDKSIPRRLGPKRANKIRKLFNIPRHSQNIGKKDAKKVQISHQDVCRLVVRRQTKEINGKKLYKAPKIQRLVTQDRLNRKIRRRKEKYEKVRENATKLAEFLAKKKAAAEAPKKKTSDAKKPEVKKDATKDAKKDDKKAEPAKDVKKAEPKKDEKKAEPKKAEPKKEEKKPEVKKAEPKKEEKKAEPKKEEKKAEPKKADKKK